MASSELMDLNGGVGLTSTEVASAQGLYVVDATGNSRFVSFANLKTAINTDPTIVPSSEPWRGARAVRTATLSITSGAEANITWQSTDLDTDSIWSAGAPTRVTVPAGVTKVRVTGGVRWASSSVGTSRMAGIVKNGATIPGNSFSGGAPSGTSAGHSLDTGVIAVTAGDYFELRVFHNVGAALNVVNDAATFLCLDIVEATP